MAFDVKSTGKLGVIPGQPGMLATWSFGQAALAAAWPALGRGGSGLDAVEAACRHAEADLANHTVGVGGLPDCTGEMSLDAAVMLSPSRRGGVCAIRSFANPISLARRVMEQTPHTLLAGDGAEQFAAQEGFKKSCLLTTTALQAWEKWKASQESDSRWEPTPNFEEHPVARAELRNIEHDTIGVVAMDCGGVLAAACSTSGLPWKLPGRVGDSPIIGHGLYCRPGIGACVCTGHGELVSGICASFLAVEALSRGSNPLQAADQVLERLTKSYSLTERDQVGIIILSGDGTFAVASLRPGFKAALRTTDRDVVLEPHLVAMQDAPR